MLQSGERQVSPDISGIRADHVARYEWADGLIPDDATVLDIGAGIGYGADLLATSRKVTGVEIDAETVEYARRHYDAAQYVQADIARKNWTRRLGTYGAATAFEVIEHIKNPRQMLEAIPAQSLYCSVPNEAHFPYKPEIAFHHRHYTEGEFRALLESAGWRVAMMRHQEGPESEVGLTPGRTLVAHCVRDERAKQSLKGKHVAIVAMGGSSSAYLDYVKCLGGRKPYADEVWGVNAIGDLLQCDRIFHMDDVRVQMRRAEARPESNIARMMDWMREHPGPVYTSHYEPGFPGLVEFPLRQIVGDLREMYFNGTVAYAVAFAIWSGVRKISIFGCDYSYEHSHHAEKGRACLEYWLGIAKGRKINLSLPRNTSLMDACEGPDALTYGYDGYEVRAARDASLTIKERDLPTADEIEARYDHSKPTSPHVRAAMEGNR